MPHRIPQYFLYGETSQDVDERFLHIEAIAERSRLHHWTIRPHAHRDLHHLLLVAGGGGMFHADDREVTFAAPALISVPLACVHSFDFTPDTDGWIVTASGALLGRVRRDHPELTPVINAAAATPLQAPAASSLSELFESLAAEFRANRPARRTAVESLLTVILVSALRLGIELSSRSAPARGADSDLVGRYRAQIETQYRTSLSVAGHAAALGVSQERLRLACIRMTGCAPLVLLNARRLLEAKRNLLYTNMSIALIAECSGFDDPAYFSRFFARQTGTAPLAYRNRKVDG